MTSSFRPTRRTQVGDHAARLFAGARTGWRQGAGFTANGSRAFLSNTSKSQHRQVATLVRFPQEYARHRRTPDKTIVQVVAE
jgi:hypothetical protein